jgi:hypothetical protein
MIYRTEKYENRYIDVANSLRPQCLRFKIVTYWFLFIPIFQNTTQETFYE